MGNLGNYGWLDGQIPGMNKLPKWTRCKMATGGGMPDMEAARWWVAWWSGSVKQVVRQQRVDKDEVKKASEQQKIAASAIVRNNFINLERDRHESFCGWFPFKARCKAFVSKLGAVRECCWQKDPIVDAERELSATENPSETDLIVLNTCHIREKARHKVVSRLGVLKNLSRKQRPQNCCCWMCHKRR